MIFKCQSCGKLYPIVEAEPYYVRDIEDLICRKCYAKRSGTDCMVNVLTFIDVAD